jgi:hypothetical protein
MLGILGGGELQEAGRELIEQANVRGGTDNITVVILSRGEQDRRRRLPFLWARPLMVALGVALALLAAYFLADMSDRPEPPPSVMRELQINEAAPCVRQSPAGPGAQALRLPKPLACGLGAGAMQPARSTFTGWRCAWPGASA